MNDLRGGAFPIAERAAVFLKAVFSCKDPLLEVALEGLARSGLGTDLQLAYAARALRKGEFRRFFESAKANESLCAGANDLAVEAIERRGERIIQFERRRPVFVFDE